MHSVPMTLRTVLPVLTLSLAAVLVFAQAAWAGSVVRLVDRGTGPDGVARVLLSGDDNASQITVQRAPQPLDQPAGDRITITDASGVTRDETDFLTAIDGGGYCGNAGATEVFCVVLDDAPITTAGSALGDGGDQIIVLPASGGPEVQLDVEGGAGNDILVGGAGRDRLDGGPGSDQLAGLGGGDFLFDTGADDQPDTVSYDDAAHTVTGVNVTIGDGTANDGTQGVDGSGATSLDDVGAGIDRVVGTNFDDVLFGSAAPETLVGGLGTDVLYGQGGNDRLEARDDTVDGTLDCGDGDDTAVVDADDPAPAHCETQDRPAPPAPNVLTRPTLTSVALPDIRKGVYAGLSIDGIEAQLGKVIPSTVVAMPLDYAQAASRAGKAKVTPFDIVASSPNPGARVTGSMAKPVAVRAFFWDPTKDVKKQPCTKKVVIRGKGGRGPKQQLSAALKGLGFREGKAGSEGDAQDLLRRIGCPYDAVITYSAKARESTVLGAKFTTLTRKTKANGKVRTTKVKGYQLRVQAPYEGSDFLVTFGGPYTVKGTDRPMNGALQLAAGHTLQLKVNVREKATGRIAEGTLAELTAPGGGTIAAGRTDANGMVSLTGYVAQAGQYDLSLSRSRVDPVTKDAVDQQGLSTLTAVTPGRGAWDGLGTGALSTRRGAPTARAAAGVGPFQYLQQVVGALTARAITDHVRLAAGLTQAQADVLLSLNLQLLNVPLDSDAAAIAGVRRLNLVPAIATTRAGRPCGEWKAPAIETRTALGVHKDDAIEGRTVGARFDCGRAVLMDPQSGLLLVGQGYAIGSALIANDGASLIANDGASLIANDGASLIANDGASFVPLTPLLANDGASLMSDHGAGIVSNHSGAIVSNHSSGFVQPLGAGTTFQTVGR